MKLLSYFINFTINVNLNCKTSGEFYFFKAGKVIS